MAPIQIRLCKIWRMCSITKDWCRKACLDDCFCAVAIFGGGQCLKKKIHLLNGRLDPTNATNKVLIKIRKDNSTFKPSGADLLKKNHSTVILTVSVLLCSSIFLNLLFLLAAFLPVFHFKLETKGPRNIPIRPRHEFAKLHL